MITTPCVSLFYVNDIGTTGSRRTVGIPYIYLHLNSDAGYAVLPLTVTQAGLPVSLRLSHWQSAAVRVCALGFYLSL